MDSAALKQLYNEVIMKHQKSPCHFLKEGGEPSFVASNPMCGDTFKIFLQGENDESLTAHFNGFGCALSKASTSILMEAVEGKTRDEALAFCQNFLAAAEGRKEWKSTDEINMLVDLRNHGGRMDCIKLSWKALAEHLEES